MAKTRAQLVTSVQGSTGRLDKDSVIEDGLDFGLGALTRRHRWRQGRSTSEFTLTAADETVTLPTGSTHVFWVFAQDGTTSGWPVRVLNERMFNQVVPNMGSVADGKPFICWKDGLTLRFAPGAGSAYKLQVRVNKVQSFANDSATSPYEETDEALISYASAYLFRSIENFESADRFDARFSLLSAEAISLDKSYTEEIPKQPFGFSSSLSEQFFDINDPFLMETP